MNSDKMEFYYQIKGKLGNSDYGWGNWTFPPIFSDKISAENKKEARKLIELEYNKKFPLRVLTKDLDNNEFLLRITEMNESNYYDKLFQQNECKECKLNFRRIDLYNDANSSYKGTEYCCDDCKEKAYERERGKINDSMFNESGNIPVIYKITNKITNKCYIGQTIQSFTLRWWQHIKWGQSGCKFHTAIKESKLTDWKFEVIDIVEKNKLTEREAHYINKFDSINNGYNSATVNGNDNNDRN